MLTAEQPGLIWDGTRDDPMEWPGPGGTRDTRDREGVMETGKGEVPGAIKEEGEGL